MKESEKLCIALVGVLMLGIIVVSLACLSSAPGARGADTIKNNNSTGVAPGFYLNYHTSAETVYDDIVINGSGLTYTYFDHENATLDPHNVAQVALYSEGDLKTVEANLSAREVDRLISLINDTRFMSLDDNYGGAGPGQRNYPYTITVKYGGSEKKVVYQSFPRAAPAPAGFVAMQEALAGLVRDKFGRNVSDISGRMPVAIEDPYVPPVVFSNDNNWTPPTDPYYSMATVMHYRVLIRCTNDTKPYMVDLVQDYLKTCGFCTVTIYEDLESNIVKDTAIYSLGLGVVSREPAPGEAAKNLNATIVAYHKTTGKPLVFFLYGNSTGNGRKYGTGDAYGPFFDYVLGRDGQSILARDGLTPIGPTLP